MRRADFPALAAAVTIVMLALTGCASDSDVKALRQEIGKTQEMARAAEARAAAAEAEAKAAKAEAANAAAEARRAAEQAGMASEKADRIFRESLRK